MQSSLCSRRVSNFDILIEEKKMKHVDHRNAQKFQVISHRSVDKYSCKHCQQYQSKLIELQVQNKAMKVELNQKKTKENEFVTRLVKYCETMKRTIEKINLYSVTVDDQQKYLRKYEKLLAKLAIEASAFSLGQPHRAVNMKKHKYFHENKQGELYTSIFSIEAKKKSLNNTLEDNTPMRDSSTVNNVSTK